MKKESLLFKNAFKQAFRNKIQLVGLIVLVLLSSTIFSLMETSLSRISSEYVILIGNDPQHGSNLHDFVIDLSETATIGPIPATPFLEEKSNIVINNIANEIDNSFMWDRVEGRNLQLDNNKNQRVLKLLTYNNQARIDRLVISDGYTIGDSNNPDKLTPAVKQTVINKEFAYKNNLHIGDIIRVQKDQLGTSLKVNYDINNPIYSIFNWLKIVGFGTSADFTTPIIDQTTPIPNKTREGVLYVDPISFGLSNSRKDNNFFWTYNKQLEHFSVSSQADREVYFVGKWNHGQNNNITNVSNQLRTTYVSIIDADAKLVYNLGDSDYRFNSRTSILTGTINGFTSLLIALLLIVLVITGITVVLITYKNIDNSRMQIGILKSLGYSNIKILITSLAYPMVAAFIGTILVFLPASGLQLIVVHTFANYFNLDFGKFVFDGLGFLYCLILTFGFLSIIAWVISALTVIQNPIKLIKNESVTADSHFTRAIKRVSINRGFLTRFRLALFTSSIGKMAAASLTMFLGTTLMTTAIIGPKIMADNKLLSFTGMNYKSAVEYNIPTYNSPYTFYQTYNPNTKPWDYKTIKQGTDTYQRPLRGDENNDEFVKEILANNINSEAYAPMTFANASAALSTLGLFSLTYLDGKMFTKSFLNGLDSSDANSPYLISTIVPSAWPAAWPIYLNALQNTDVDSYYSNDNYNLLRKFYQDYRSTVAMNISGVISKSGQLSDNPNDFSNTLFKSFATKNDFLGKKTIPAYDNIPPISEGGDTFETTIDNFQFDQSDKAYPWHVTNEKEILTKSATELPSQASRNSWINKISTWFGALFYSRIGQTVVQGTYSRSPYFIRQNIANAYNDPNSPFNISFNVLPFNNKTDELGTYFVGEPDKYFNGHKYPMKVYGLQSQQQLEKPSMMQLYDSDGNVLNPLLESDDGSDTTRIVINQTIAKQLNLHVNDPFMMTTNGNIMEFKNNPGDDYTHFNVKDISFTELGKNIVGNRSNNVTLNKQSTRFTKVNKLKDNPYVSLNTATKMLKENVAGNVVTTRDSILTKYKVVGIYNGYGQPNAYISKTNADKLLHYNDKTVNNTDSRSMLFRIFQMEWKNEATWNGIDFSVLKPADMDYAKFVNDATVDPNLVKVFDNEYPLFNFKFSNSDVLPDITNSFSTSQIYGDYSPFGLNGGFEEASGETYEGYGVGSALNVSPLYVHYQLLNQITTLVDAVLAAFIVFSLIISFFIILLTSNLVIYENRKVIATMKTLGYSDSKITNIVIGMYLPLIIAMFVIGFPIGWVIVSQVISYLALHTIWVLPLFFTWWLPFVVAGIVLGIYGATFMIGWNSMKKINPIKTLNEID
ncbi:ABC transporter permease [Spiroplasma endosymbiont of Nebria brevicollis]|uniref:ABC transporter permease n=1 Tax=Spiroplasma endosymbiont of Nebria brevicollis TaxID=3066284 RepID=UPI00313CA5B9